MIFRKLNDDPSKISSKNRQEKHSYINEDERQSNVLTANNPCKQRQGRQNDLQQESEQAATPYDIKGKSKKQKQTVNLLHTNPTSQQQLSHQQKNNITLKNPKKKDEEIFIPDDDLLMDFDDRDFDDDDFDLPKQTTKTIGISAKKNDKIYTDCSNLRDSRKPTDLSDHKKVDSYRNGGLFSNTTTKTTTNKRHSLQNKHLAATCTFSKEELSKCKPIKESAVFIDSDVEEDFFNDSFNLSGMLSKEKPNPDNHFVKEKREDEKDEDMFYELPSDNFFDETDFDNILGDIEEIEEGYLIFMFA